MRSTVLAVSSRATMSPVGPPPRRFDANVPKANTVPFTLVADGVGLATPPLASWPDAVTLTRRSVPVVRSKAKTSLWPLVSPLTRFDAFDVNTTVLPSPLIDGAKLSPFGSALPGPVLTRVVVPASRSWTKTLRDPGSPDTNATTRPFAEIAGNSLGPGAPVLTRVVVPAVRSRTKMSDVALLSLETMSSELEANAT
jgi:hypothetical protein